MWSMSTDRAVAQLGCWAEQEGQLLPICAGLLKSKSLYPIS